MLYVTVETVFLASLQALVIMSTTQFVTDPSAIGTICFSPLEQQDIWMSAVWSR